MLLLNLLNRSNPIQLGVLAQSQVLWIESGLLLIGFDTDHVGIKVPVVSSQLHESVCKDVSRGLMHQRGIARTVHVLSAMHLSLERIDVAKR